MLYGHTVSALLAPRYQTGTWFDIWVFQRGLTSRLFLLLSGFAFSIATGRHWASHTQFSPAVLKRLRRFSLFVVLGYALHFPVQRFVDLPSATPEQWRSFLAVDVLQLIGVTFIGVQALVLVSRSRRAFAWTAFLLALVAVLVAPLFWGVDWARRLPLSLAAYLSPSAGSQFPCLPMGGVRPRRRGAWTVVPAMGFRTARLVCERGALRARAGAGDAGVCRRCTARVGLRRRRMGLSAESGGAAHGRVAHPAVAHRPCQPAHHAPPACLRRRRPGDARSSTSSTSASCTARSGTAGWRKCSDPRSDRRKQSCPSSCCSRRWPAWPCIGTGGSTRGRAWRAGRRLRLAWLWVYRLLVVLRPGRAHRGARRPAGKARRPSIPGVFERGATPPGGMPRPKGATDSARYRPLDTTLSDPQLMKPLFGLLHPAHVLRATDKQQPGKDFLYEGPGLRKRQPRSLAGPHPFGLEKRIGDRADHHVVLPARIRSAFEVVEAEFALEILVMLFDRPPVMRQPHQLRERRRRRAARRNSGGGVRSARGRARRAARPPGRAVDAASRWPGVTRSAAKSASHGGLVPLRHSTRRHARARQRVAERAHADRPPGRASPSRRLRGGGCCAIDAQRRRPAEDRQRRRDAQGIRAGAGDAASVGPCCCPRIRRRPRPRSASCRPRASAAAASAPAAISLETRPPPESAPRRGARGSLVHASGRYSSGAHGPRPLARPQRRRHGHLAIGDLAQRAAVLPRHAHRMRARFRESSFRRGSECPCARAAPPAAGATRPRRPTAHA